MHLMVKLWNLLDKQTDFQAGITKSDAKKVGCCIFRGNESNMTGYMIFNL